MGGGLGMSIKLMSQVWERQFDKAEQAIMLALADHAHDDGTECRPGILKVAWKTDYSPRHVKRVMQKLRDKGVLVVVRRATQHQPNVYAINLAAVPKKQTYAEYRDEHIDEVQGGPDVTSDQRGQGVPPDASQGGHGGTRGDTGDMPEGTAMSPKPSKNRHEEPSSLLPPSEASEPAKKQRVPDEEKTEAELRKLTKKRALPVLMKREATAFEGFWSRYPRGRRFGKPGGDGAKRAALESWCWNLTPQERQEALSAVEHFAAAVEADPTALVPHAATWLNQERFGDWQEPAKPRPISATRSHENMERGSDAWGTNVLDPKDVQF